MNSTAVKITLMDEFLRQYEEPLPVWLANYREGENFTFDDVVSSRLGYYPGFRKDGTLLMIGNRSHTIHSFVHTDYMNMREDVRRQVEHIRGYHVIGKMEWQINESLPLPSIGTEYRKTYELMMERFGAWISRWTDDTPYLITHIMERDSDRGEDFGALRIAVTSSNLDGFVLYLLLFMEKCKKAPWLFLLQDHAWGGNHNRFGKKGLLEQSMFVAGHWPKFVICDPLWGTNIWYGYKKLDQVEPVIGGMHRNVRYLWEVEDEFRGRDKMMRMRRERFKCRNVICLK